MPSGDTTITLAGNLTADPDLRYTPAGVAVAAFTVASSRRVYDADSGQWKDGDTLFLRCSAWRQLAEHSAESLRKSMRVVVTGRLRQSEYETTEGDKRTVFEVNADDVGPSLRWATAKVAKSTRERAPHPAGEKDRSAASEPAGATAGAGGMSRRSDPRATGPGGLGACRPADSLPAWIRRARRWTHVIVMSVGWRTRCPVSRSLSWGTPGA